MLPHFPWIYYANNTNDHNNIALIDGNAQVYSWQQLALIVNHIANAFQRQGVNAQSGVALCGKNSLELLFSYLALLQLGARVLGINPSFKQDKIEHICQQSAVQFCLFFPYNIEENSPLTVLHYPELSKFEQKFAGVAFSLDCPATMTLTSGSTGMAKAVVHSIGAHLANAEGVCKLMAFDSTKSWLLSLPLYHVSGQGIVWRWLFAKAILHLPSDDFYASVLNSTHVSLVPTQLQRFLDYLQQHNMERYLTSDILLGGTQIPIELTQCLQQFAIRSYAGYGMTEMASTVCAKRSDGHIGVGQPLFGRKVRLENGEIWLQGAGLALGYWLDNQIVPLTNNEGWLQTKDKGEWQNGELVILGRMDNMFISGGENIQPEEIERILQQCDLVKQAFVLPVDDPEFGKRPVAFIEFFHPFSTALSTELQNWLSDKIERFKQPIAYFPLEMEKWQNQGAIKISRSLLKEELTHFWKAKL